jgi:hypothetical protein
VNRVAVLFARADSFYKALPFCDVWDAERDARRWPGGAPVVAHPPCRSWGNLRGLAKPAPGERAAALWAVRQVREFGGVLEHPSFSTLWPAAALPAPGKRDRFGGYTVSIRQFDFGHPCAKKTWLYVVGVPSKKLPPLPHLAGRPKFVITSSKRDGEQRPDCPRMWRDATPPLLAWWLCEVAMRARL